MKLKPKLTITDFFKDIDDPRIERSKLHKLTDIITIAICAVICGADTWEDIEIFGDAKYKWFKKFLDLENGIPSHDTFARVFAREDDSRIRKDNGPQNFGVLRRIALNILNQEETLKKGIRRKRNKAGWDDNYLEEVLGIIV